MNATTESGNPVVAEVLAAEDARLEALHSGDFSTFAEYLADDLRYVHLTARVDDKAALVKASQESPRTYVWEERTVRPFGDVALLHGDYVINIAPLPDGTPGRSSHGRVAQVWSKRSGNWQLVSSQTTRIQE